MSELSIIIPAYNEEQSIASMLDALLPIAQAQTWQVIVVNDGSEDGTSTALAAYMHHDGLLRIITHRVNRGYGAALKTGIHAAQTPFVGTMDSDGQHRTEDFVALAQHKDAYDLVIGRRPSVLAGPAWRAPGKLLLQLMAVALIRQPIPDLNSGMRIFRRETVLRYMHLFPNGFSFSTTSTMIFMHRGYAVHFHPITVRPRAGKSTVKLSTGFDTILLVIRIAMLLDPLRLFLPISALFILVGVAWTLPFLLRQEGYSIGALLLILTGVQIFIVALISDQIAALRKERFE
ncbi:MAG: glycosyltransferase family 2 protein [Anaerolineales bacterium]